MSTRENKPVPKHYIVAGINKHFLTPCRRIGLSRSKKTPKNASTNLSTPIPNVAVETAVRSVKKRSDTNNEILDFDEAPIPRKAKTNNDQTAIETENIETNHLKVDSIPETKKTSSPNVAVKTIVAVQVHHPVPKKNINFNKMNEPPSPCPSTSTTKQQKSDIDKNISIFTPVAEKNAPNSYQIEELREEFFVTADIRNRKRKLRLDGDDFISNENEAESTNCPKTILTPKRTIIKKSNENSNGSITLSRFTTDDYLKEYSTNPEIFQENLKENGCIVSNSRDDDMDAFCTIKSNPVKNKEKHGTKSPHLSKKNYVAILCPAIDQSVVNKKPKSSLFTKKSSLELKRLSEKLPSKLKPKLTISLERLPKEDLENKEKTKDKEDIKLKEFLSTPEPFSLIVHSKINCEDDELFTSSPEGDKKQHENLLQFIINIEHEIKQKEEKLEKLRQAQVYKKKHSPEKLKVSSDRWLEGCKAGLNDLLVKMQEHGTMDLDNLIKKLRIPDGIVEKLKL